MTMGDKLKPCPLCGDDPSPQGTWADSLIECSNVDCWFASGSAQIPRSVWQALPRQSEDCGGCDVRFADWGVKVDGESFISERNFDKMHARAESAEARVRELEVRCSAFSVPLCHIDTETSCDRCEDRGRVFAYFDPSRHVVKEPAPEARDCGALGRARAIHFKARREREPVDIPNAITCILDHLESQDARLADLRECVDMLRDMATAPEDTPPRDDSRRKDKNDQ